jgi:hypothetical protein
MANRTLSARAHFLLRTGLGLSLVALALLCNARAEAAGVNIDQIEEDWELVVQEPDTSTQAPQVTCVTSPRANIDGVYAMFTLNHRTFTSFSAGGMQLQIWNGDNPITRKSASKGILLTNNDETIRWTTRIKVDNGQLTFEIVNGSSTTWGNFGSSGTLRLSVYTSLDDLNDYSPTVSQNNSEIGYASNRVTSLTLKRFRAFANNSLIGEDSTPRIVHLHE